MYFRRLEVGEPIPKQLKEANPDLAAYMDSQKIKLKPKEVKPVKKEVPKGKDGEKV